MMYANVGMEKTANVPNNPSILLLPIALMTFPRNFPSPGVTSKLNASSLFIIIYIIPTSQFVSRPAFINSTLGSSDNANVVV